MDQVHVIRHQVLVEGRSQRSVAREHGVSRNTVRKYLDQSEPRRVESRPRRRLVTERMAPRLEELLRDVVSPDDGEAAADGYASASPVAGGWLRGGDHDGSQLRSGVEASAAGDVSFRWCTVPASVARWTSSR